jgi:hypothetical protein
MADAGPESIPTGFDEQRRKPQPVPTSVEPIIVRAAKRMLRTAVELSTAREELVALRKEWGTQIRSARSDVNDVLDGMRQVIPNSPSSAEADILLRVNGNADTRDDCKRQRKSLHEQMSAATKEIVSIIEAGIPSAAARGSAETIALQRLGVAWQTLCELEAGKKDAFSLVLAKIDELEAKREQQVEGARQLSLFD